MKYPLVLDLAADGIAVAVTCRVLGFSEQAFYAWMKNPISQRCRHDSEIPKSFAICDNGASPLRATATTSRRNSRGNAFGMANILPARNKSSQARSQPSWGQSHLCAGAALGPRAC